MIKNKKKIFLIVAILFLCIGIIGIKNTKADSGWDTSYDSGSSWSSSSSSGSWSSSDWGSSRSSSGSSSYSSTPMTKEEARIFSIVMILMAGLTLGLCIISSKKKTKFPIRERYTLSKDEIHQIDPSLDIEEFKKMAYESFVDIQNAWMNFDYDTLRAKLSDELYNQYEMQLEALKNKGQQNIMTDFENYDSSITNGITSIKINDDIETIDFQLKVSFKDYVVNSSKKVIRGNKHVTYGMVYILTFTRKLSNTIDKCPKCGAPIENTNFNKCPYCRATIKINGTNFVMSKKALLGQENN